LTSDSNLKKIIFYSLPGFVSIFISALSILLFLNYFSNTSYANYIIQHLFITIGQGVLNLNLGRIAAIKIQNLDSTNKKKIISTAILTSFISGVILSTFVCLFFLFFLKKFNIIEITLTLLFGLVISCIYQTCEDIGKGMGYVKLCSASNLLFFNISISIPAILMINEPTKSIIIDYAFEISVFVKFLTLFFLIVVFLKKKIFSLEKFELKKIQNFFYPSIWLTISAIFSQIFYNCDKYFIKISLGASQLILYSLPQQLSQKLGIISQAISSVILPKLSKKTNNKKKILTANIYGIFYFLSIVLIITLPFLDYILSFIFKNKYNDIITIMLKIFILINFFNCISNIIIDSYHSEMNTRKDVRYLFFASVPFVIGLILCSQFKQILFFVALIFFKDFILLIKRILSAKHLIKNYKLLILQIIILNGLYMSEIYKKHWTYIAFAIIFLFLFIKNSNKDLILNYFYNKNKKII
jgi:O-antigen/teichoic acid export membrane protein